MLACLFHRSRKKLISLSLTLLSIAVALFALSLILSQNNILFYKPILLIGAFISIFILLCILLPQWIGFPALIVLGAIVVFLAIQVFRFPSSRYQSAKYQSTTLGTLVISIDENHQSISVIQPLQSQKKEYIPINTSENLKLQYMQLKSPEYVPFYGGIVWIILYGCVSDTATITFQSVNGNVFLQDSSAAQFLARLFGFNRTKQELFINLDEHSKNNKQIIKWSNDSILIGPL